MAISSASSREAARGRFVRLVRRRCASPRPPGCRPARSARSSPARRETVAQLPGEPLVAPPAPQRRGSASPSSRRQASEAGVAEQRVGTTRRRGTPPASVAGSTRYHAHALVGAAPGRSRTRGPTRRISGCGSATRRRVIGVRLGRAAVHMRGGHRLIRRCSACAALAQPQQQQSRADAPPPAAGHGRPAAALSRVWFMPAAAPPATRRSSPK